MGRGGVRCDGELQCPVQFTSATCKGLKGKVDVHRYTLIRNHLPLGPYSRPLPRVLWRSLRGGGQFLMSEVPLQEIKFSHGLLAETGARKKKQATRESLLLTTYTVLVRIHHII